MTEFAKIITRRIAISSATALIATVLSACGGGGGGDGAGIAPPPAPEPTALANAVDLVANDSRQVDGDYVGGWWNHREDGSDSATTITLSHSQGVSSARPTVSYDTDGNLHHNVSLSDRVPLQEAGPWTRAGRYIDTREGPQERVGVTSSARSVSDHSLGSDWQVTELTSAYDGGGNLTILVATDVQQGDMSMDPFNITDRADYSIELPTAPARPVNRDTLIAYIPDGESIEGSLDAVAGTFSCANADNGCVFVSNYRQMDFYSIYPDVTFTSRAGVTQDVEPRVFPKVPPADYLAFGYWLHVPEDIMDSDAYDFGVYASGGDAFNVANLRALTGTAIYNGDAVGMYYLNSLSSNPSVGSFDADVQLTADFGSASETGFISGMIDNFQYEGDVASSLPAMVNLTSRPYSSYFGRFDVPQDSTNIFDTVYRNRSTFPGGKTSGVTEASVDGVDWNGVWHGAFYGNGGSPTDHPTSVAGVFSTTIFNDNSQSDSGLTGSFGAHRQ